MHIDFIDEDYDGALDEFDSSSSDDDSDNEGSANTGSGGGIFGFGRQRPEVEERYNRSQRIRALEERLQQTQTQWALFFKSIDDEFKRELLIS